MTFADDDALSSNSGSIPNNGGGSTAFTNTSGGSGGERLKEREGGGFQPAERRSSMDTRRKGGIQQEIDSIVVAPTTVRASLRASLTYTTNSHNTSSSYLVIDEEDVDQVTMDQLRFSSLGLVGRNQEKMILSGCVERSVHHQTRELILISGVSGTGKTALATTLQPKPQQKGLFISGKFDLYLRDEPYAGVASACRELCTELLALRDNNNSNNNQAASPLSPNFQTICDQIVEELGADLPLLIKIIPQLEQVLGTRAAAVVVGVVTKTEGEDESKQQQQQQQQKKQGGGGGGLDEAKKRINHAFRRLFHIICSSFPSVIIALDDLQWADLNSLDLIEVLMLDRTITNLLIVGCYRSNEVDETHLVSKMLRELRDKSSSSTNSSSTNSSSTTADETSTSTDTKDCCEDDDNFHMTEITIDNLQIPHVQEMLMELLSVEDDKALPLAQVCHRKTNGNAFFLVQFISHLNEQGLLTFNFGLCKWIWSEATIESETASTANVVDLVKNKMTTQLPTDTVQLLPILACLGSSVQEPLVKTVWQAYCDGLEQQQKEQHPQPPQSQPVTQVGPLLVAAAQEGFLEQAGPEEYRFVHDNIQEAALSLVDKEKLAAFKSTIGNILVQQPPKELESNLFVAVNLLNEGLPPQEAKQQMDIVELNLRAAQKAFDLSAFTSSSKYVLKGIDLLPLNKWRDVHYTTTLELYTLAAQVQGNIGYVESMQLCCDEVLGQTHRPLADKFRVYNVLHNSMFNRGDHNAAIDLGIDLLKKLGCQLPQNQTAIKLATAAGITRVKAGLKSNKMFDQIESLSVINDPIKLETMHLLDKSILYCFFARGKMVPLLTLKLVRLTLRHGLCEYSPPAFANLGLILASSGDFQIAAKMAEYALKMTEKIACRNTLARTMLLSYWGVFPWSKPLSTTLKPFLQSYRVGLATGDTESALWCIHNYIAFGLLSGKNLALLTADCEIYVKHILTFEHIKIAKYTEMQKQMIWNLQQSDDKQSDMTTQFDPITGLVDDRYNDEPLMVHALNNYQNRMFALFGEHTRGAELSIRRENKFQEECPGNFLTMNDAFYRGISLYAAARGGGGGQQQRKFKQLAKQQHATISGWARKGNPNVLHCEVLLDAEHAALKRRDAAARELYQKGIVMAAKAGFVQDAGLGSERFAEYCLNELSDTDAASYNLQEAIRFYSGWGASRKVKMIQTKHLDLFTNPDLASANGKAATSVPAE